MFFNNIVQSDGIEPSHLIITCAERYKKSLLGLQGSSQELYESNRVYK